MTTATTTRTVSAQLPNGVMARRTTTQPYTKLVAARSDNNFWSAFAWVSAEQTAQKRAKDAKRAGFVETRILDLVDESAAPAAAEQGAGYTASHAEAPSQLVNVAPIVSLKIVRDTEIAAPARIKSPADIYAMLRDRFADADREQFIVVCLGTKNDVLAVNVAFIGTLNACSITLREVFKAAIAVGAASIVVSHNHPSADPTPSPEDVLLTREIVKAGELLDIQLLDHIVLGGDGRWVSFRERGMGFTK